MGKRSSFGMSCGWGIVLFGKSLKIYTTFAPSSTGKLPRCLEGGINLTFKRNFGAQERTEWDELERDLEGIELNDDVDSVR
jgi:hypothetical protein